MAYIDAESCCCSPANLTRKGHSENHREGEVEHGSAQYLRVESPCIGIELQQPCAAYESQEDTHHRPDREQLPIRQQQLFDGSWCDAENRRIALVEHRYPTERLE